MKKHALTKLFVLAFACCFQNAQAAVLTVDMPGNNLPYTTSAGSLFDANIYINSVTDLAGFDFYISYSSAKLQALSLSSGNIFGASETETIYNSIVPNSIHFSEAISGLSSLTAGLNINAPALLATVHFKALTTGVNNLVTINNPILSDFVGNSLGGSIHGAYVTITPAAVVPLPASAILFGSALLGLAGLRKKA